jgi:hypothetical protein
MNVGQLSENPVSYFWYQALATGRCRLIPQKLPSLT